MRNGKGELLSKQDVVVLSVYLFELTVLFNLSQCFGNATDNIISVDEKILVEYTVKMNETM